MRNTLGVGPCEHILDLEGQKSEYKGMATCDVRDTLTPIYEKNEQKAETRRGRQGSSTMALTFVKHIRGRITRYVEFGKKMQQYLAEQKKAHPELSEFIAEMDRLTREIDDRVAARVDKIKTPEHVAQMNEDFRKNVLDYDGPGRLEAMQGVHRGPGGDRRQPGRAVGRMPLGGEGPAATGGHRASPWTPGWRRSPRKSAPGRRRRCATPPATKGLGTNPGF